MATIQASFANADEFFNNLLRHIIPHDAEMYKWRHLIENHFQSLKEYRRIATGYDKTDTSFAAFIHLRAARLPLR